MSNAYQDTLADVIGLIRSTINEDWIEDFEIDAATRFNSDLEIESIEFVRIADAIQGHYGAALDIVGWLSGKSIHELIALSVGELCRFIVDARGVA
jgi:acyl carrier protein